MRPFSSLSSTSNIFPVRHIIPAETVGTTGATHSYLPAGVSRASRDAKVKTFQRTRNTKDAQDS